MKKLYYWSKERFDVTQKILTVLLFSVFCFATQAQNYKVTFSSSGENMIVDSVQIHNITQKTSMSLLGYEILNLVRIPTIIKNFVASEDFIKVYPNPMTQNAILEVFCTQSGEVNVQIFNISGKQIAQNKNNLSPGISMYQISGLKSGIYLIKVQLPNDKYSTKLISINVTDDIPQINLRTTNSVTDLKSANIDEPAEMQYNEGDSILFIGYSGDLKDTLGYVLTADANIEFNFETPFDINFTLAEIYEDFKSYIEFSFLFDAAYSQSKELSANWDSIASHILTPADSKVAALWFNAYDIIYRINSVLENALLVENLNEQQLIIGQAKCIRAYLYYTLAFWFGNVPIETGTASSNLPRNIVDDVYSFIEDDLNMANHNLPAVIGSSEEIKLSKFFASGILARTLLLRDELVKSQELKDITSQVINSGMFALPAEVDTFYSGSIENIFGFDGGDVGFMQEYNFQFVPAMRYTEIIMMHVEAAYKLGQTQNALQLMNMLLLRRNMDPLTLLSLDDIYQQWKTELKYEGRTFACYKRFNKIREELMLDEYRFLLPVPLQVIIENPYMVQNPGY